jgi:hypothetical protein
LFCSRSLRPVQLRRPILPAEGGDPLLSEKQRIHCPTPWSVDSPGGRSEQNGIILEADGEQLAKADKLPVNVELASNELKPLISTWIDPVTASADTTGSVSAGDQRPHEGKAPRRSIKSAMREVRKNRNGKAKRSPPTNNKVECQTPQTIIDYFNRSTHCPVTSTTTAKRTTNAR